MHTLIIGGVGVMTITLWVVLGHSYPSTLMINEVSFSNNDGQDWIEIYNPSLSSVSLKGYYISDSEKQLNRFQITEDIIVPSHGYLVLYGENSTAATTGTQLSFNISNGETVYLVASDGVTIIDRLTVIKHEDDDISTSVGRFPDGSEETFTFSVGTPGRNNDKDEVTDRPFNRTEIP